VVGISHVLAERREEEIRRGDRTGEDIVGK
jgi:hypothetical protein